MMNIICNSKNEDIKYHPNMFKIFTEKELDLLQKCAASFIDEDGYIGLMYLCIDKITCVEIYTGSIGGGEEVIIEDLEAFAEYDHDYPIYLTKNEFWDLFINSKQTEMQCVAVDNGIE